MSKKPTAEELLSVYLSKPDWMFRDFAAAVRKKGFAFSDAQGFKLLLKLRTHAVESKPADPSKAKASRAWMDNLSKSIAGAKKRD